MLNLDYECLKHALKKVNIKKKFDKKTTMEMYLPNKFLDASRKKSSGNQLRKKVSQNGGERGAPVSPGVTVFPHKLNLRLGWKHSYRCSLRIRLRCIFRFSGPYGNAVYVYTI